MRDEKTSTAFKLLLGLLIAGGVLSLGLAAFLLAWGTYTIHDGREVLTVDGRYETVGDVLAAASLTLRPEDLVQPALTAPAAAQTVIQIQRARPVAVSRAGGDTSTYWTQQVTVGDFLIEAGISLDERQELWADDRLLEPAALGTAPLAATLRIQERLVPVTIADGAVQQTLETSAGTVGELLSETGIVLAEGEQVVPEPDTPLAEDLQIEVQRTMPVSIVADGQTTAVQTVASDVAGILSETGFVLGPFDYTVPALDAALQAGETLRIVRVREETLTTEETLPYQTVFQPSAELDLDSKAQLSPGSPGLKQRVIRARFEDGVEVSRTDEGETVIREPVNEVIGYGTRINTGVIDTPEGPREYWRVVRMRVTAYTAATSGKAPDHPAYGITASGLPAGKGIVAVDPNVIPFRSEVFVPGYGVGFAGDTGGGVKGLWIDLGFDEDALETWNGYTDVYFLTPVPEEINYLLPEVLP